MTRIPSDAIRLDSIGDDTRQLVRVAAAVAAHDAETVRGELAAARQHVPPLWIEEVILQSYLFAGFPRALNAMREWRRLAGAHIAGAATALGSARVAGEQTCGQVYGSMYAQLRENIRALHPSLDDWMIEQGYGTVLSRPGLDLARRELCIVAACAASGQERQLHSHLHGALNAGASAGAVTGAIDALEGLVDASALRAARQLFNRITGRG